MKHQDKPNENNSTSSDIPNIKPKSTWETPKNDYTINTFIEALNNDVDELFKHKQTLPHNNISHHEKEHYKWIFKTRRFSLTKTDKGGATVILDVKDYIEKANKELKEGNYY